RADAIGGDPDTYAVGPRSAAVRGETDAVSLDACPACGPGYPDSGGEAADGQPADGYLRRGDVQARQPRCPPELHSYHRVRAVLQQIHCGALLRVAIDDYGRGDGGQRPRKDDDRPTGDVKADLARARGGVCGKDRLTQRTHAAVVSVRDGEHCCPCHRGTEEDRSSEQRSESD